MALTPTTSRASGGLLQKYAAGKYYVFPQSPTGDVGAALTLDRVLYLAIPIGEASTFDRIVCSVTTLGVGSSVRLGLYNDSDGVPGTLLLDAGTVDASTTGFKEITISQALSASTLYWAALVAQGAACSVRHAAAGNGGEWVGGTAVADDMRTSTYLQNGVAAALPATATPVLGGTTAPMLKLRAV